MGREVRRVPSAADVDAVRFWSKVEVGADNLCWPWAGRFITVRGQRRGQFSIRSKDYYAHRVVMLLAHGHWPSPQANHHCDNSICCNPAHLYEGTQADNVRDRELRNRRTQIRGEQNGRAVLTADQVEAIRSAYLPGTRGSRGAGALAARYGVHRHTIQLIGKGVIWSE